MVKHTTINNESIIALSNNFQVRNVVSLTTNMKNCKSSTSVSFQIKNLHCNAVTKYYHICDLLYCTHN